jgi:hypothetical protein
MFPLNARQCLSAIILFSISICNFVIAQNISGFTYGGTYNGHKYYLSTTTTNWAGAKSGCQQNGGYLATVTSQGENDFIFNAFKSQNVFATIGYTDEQVEGTWVWINGETSSYTHWLAGQPDNNQGIQDYARIYLNTTSSGSYWDDEQDSPTPRPFIMEIGSGASIKNNYYPNQHGSNINLKNSGYQFRYYDLTGRLVSVNKTGTTCNSIRIVNCVNKSNQIVQKNINIR